MSLRSDTEAASTLFHFLYVADKISDCVTERTGAFFVTLVVDADDNDDADAVVEPVTDLTPS